MNKMQARRLLVTGGAGFIGSNFTRYWLAKYSQDTVVVLDALTYAGCKENLNDYNCANGLYFVKGNINNRELVISLLREHHIDTIVNFAAESHVDRSIAGATDFVQTNIVGTFNLLEAARTVWLSEENIKCHHFHHVSTDEVYGSLALLEPAFTEKRQYQPNSPYAASKAASDHLIRSYHYTYGLNVTTSNCTNNYGAYQFPEKLIPLVIMKILQEQQIPIYGDGKQIRDWLHVDDHCCAIDLILSQGKYGETYNVGGNNQWSNIELVNFICQYVNQLFAQNTDLIRQYPTAVSAINGCSEQLISYVKDRLGHDQRYAIDATKISQQLGFYPKICVEDGVKATIDWYMKNPRLWQYHMHSDKAITKQE